VKILGYADGIHISNAQSGDVVSVYGMDGRLVRTVKMRSQQADIALRGNSLYIIKVADRVVKVRL
jgi:hypothetical protein